MKLSPVSEFNWFWVKREDLVCFTSLHFPSGSKVRQYGAMAEEQPGVPMVVGCSANSAMQIYVAAAAKLACVDAYVFVPKRKIPTAATQYAMDMGAKIIPVTPGYRTVYQKRAREHAASLGGAVRWGVGAALRDTMDQCANLPKRANRIVVATGSGLTAAGVLAGLARRQVKPVVVAVAVSELTSREEILKLATQAAGGLVLPQFEFETTKPLAYDRPKVAFLPDHTPLDPFYGAKAIDHVRPGDCLWLPGLRPVCSMPAEIANGFSSWEGPP